MSALFVLLNVVMISFTSVIGIKFRVIKNPDVILIMYTVREPTDLFSEN
jgi:hypothetical protein